MLLEPLHICPNCSSQMRFPIEWQKHNRGAKDEWWVKMGCPECDHVTDGVYEQDTIEELDDELDKADRALKNDAKEITRSNMVYEIDNFCMALQFDAILPEDFVI